MPRRCSVYLCDGNYDEKPYTPTVSASLNKYPEDRKKWIGAMPNDRKQLEKLATIHVCKHHFDCEWYPVQGGGERPRYPPSIFPGVPKSCSKQSVSKSRQTKTGSADVRLAMTKWIVEDNDRISDIEDFLKAFHSDTHFIELSEMKMTCTYHWLINSGKKWCNFFILRRLFPISVFCILSA